MEGNSPEEIIYNCGRFGLPREQALALLRPKLGVVEARRLQEALSDPGSPEWRCYADGMAAGEAEIAVSLHESVQESKRDSYKNFSAENRRRAINRSIRENFGIGDEDV